MEFKKEIKNIIFLPILIISLVSSFYVGLLFNTNKSYEKDSSKKEIDQVRACSKADIEYAINNLLIDRINIDKDEFTVKIVVNSYLGKEEEIISECFYDITDVFIKGFGIKKEDILQISSPVWLNKDLIAYNYEGSIYLQNFFEDKAPQKIVSREMIKGTEYYEEEGNLYQIIGPYIHSYTSDSRIYFYTSVEFGCDDGATKEYCDSMRRMIDELEKKNLVGLFEYDYTQDRISFLR